jgi:hypothetical protein
VVGKAILSWPGGSVTEDSPQARTGASEENPASIPMRVPAHGKGLLRQGGTKSPGRPASSIRRALRRGLAKRIPILEQIADTDEKSADRLKALDLMGKYGLGTEKHITHDDVRERLQATIEIIRNSPNTRDAEALIKEIEPAWR